MKKLVKLLFHIENEKKQVDEVVSGLYEFFGIPHQDAYEILSKEYIWIVQHFSPIELELDFPECSTEEDMFNCLITAFSEIQFECKINNKDFNYVPTSSKVKNVSDMFNVTLKEGYTVIRIEELEKLKRAKHALKDLRGTIKTLESKIKTILNDTRTVSES